MCNLVKVDFKMDSESIRYFTLCCHLSFDYCFILYTCMTFHICTVACVL